MVVSIAAFQAVNGHVCHRTFATLQDSVMRFGPEQRSPDYKDQNLGLVRSGWGVKNLGCEPTTLSNRPFVNTLALVVVRWAHHAVRPLLRFYFWWKKVLTLEPFVNTFSGCCCSNIQKIRHRRDLNSRGQSPLAFKTNSLTTRTQCLMF
jgi:hypothetical protein